MKFVIISDTHFGDDTCALVAKPEGSQTITAGPKYNAFAKTAGTDNDFLVLAGDVFDFSVASYQKAYEYGKAFFELIYLAGNHDVTCSNQRLNQDKTINCPICERMNPDGSCAKWGH